MTTKGDSSANAPPLKDFQALRGDERLGLAPVRLLDPHVDRDMDHQQDADDDAGNDAGKKQAADGGVGRKAVDHEHDAGRNDRPQHAGGEHHRRGERNRIALVAHRLDDDDAKPGKVGERRSGNAGEDHLRRDRDLRQAAAHPAEQVARKIEDALGDAADVEQIAGDHEKRHGEQREAVDILDHHARQHIERRVGDQHADQQLRRRSRC